jgi:hypothetical protein
LRIEIIPGLKLRLSELNEKELMVTSYQPPLKKRLLLPLSRGADDDHHTGRWKGND